MQEQKEQEYYQLGLFGKPSKAMQEYAAEKRSRSSLKKAVSDVQGYNADTAGHGPPRSEHAHEEKPKQESH